MQEGKKMDECFDGEQHILHMPKTKSANLEKGSMPEEMAKVEKKWS